MKDFLKEISKMLNRALDSEETGTGESFDLLYKISDKLESKIKELEECDG